MGTQIEGNGYLVVWATGADPLDLALEPIGPHASFKLAKSGGVALALIDTTATIIDSVTYPEIKNGDSYARAANSGEWAVDETPTRGAANN